jgi:hypothetical protein
MTVVTPVATPADLEAVEDILKEVYVSNDLESQIRDDVQTLKFFEETTEYTDSEGLHASVPLRVGRTGGIGARGIGEPLPVADHQKPGKARYNFKHLYLTVKLEGPIIARMKSNRQSVVRHIDNEINGGVNDFQRDLCRQLNTFGDAAITLVPIAAVGVAATEIPLGTGNNPILERGWLWEGMRIDIGTLGDPVASAEGLRIVSIDDDPTGPSITVSNATTVAASSHVFLHRNRSAANGSNEVNGLGNIIDDTSELGGIDPTDAGKQYWKAGVYGDAGLRDLAIPLMSSVTRKVKQFGGKTTDVLGSLGMQQEYYQLLQEQVRFAGDSNLSAGNVDGPKFQGHVFHDDPDHLPNRVTFVDKGALMMFSAGALSWQNQTTGGNILAWDQGYDAFVARAAKYAQTGTDRRRSHAVLDDLNEPAE